LCVPSMGIWY